MVLLNLQTLMFIDSLLSIVSIYLEFSKQNTNRMFSMNRKEHCLFFFGVYLGSNMEEFYYIDIDVKHVRLFGNQRLNH